MKNLGDFQMVNSQIFQLCEAISEEEADKKLHF